MSPLSIAWLSVRSSIGCNNLVFRDVQQQRRVHAPAVTHGKGLEGRRTVRKKESRPSPPFSPPSKFPHRITQSNPCTDKYLHVTRTAATRSDVDVWTSRQLFSMLKTERHTRDFCADVERQTNVVLQIGTNAAVEERRLKDPTFGRLLD